MISYNSVGARDTQIVLQAPSYSSDSESNQKIISWYDFATVWGEFIKPIRATVKNQESRGDEVFEADQQVAKTLVTIRIKFMDNIVPTMRFTIDSDIYYLTGVDTEGRFSYLILSAERRDDNLSNDSADAAGNITIEDEGIVI